MSMFKQTAAFCAFSASLCVTASAVLAQEAVTAEEPAEYVYIRPEARELVKDVDWSDWRDVNAYVSAVLPEQDFDLTPMSVEESNWERWSECETIRGMYWSSHGRAIGENAAEQNYSLHRGHILNYLNYSNILRNRDCSCATASLTSVEPVEAMYAEIYGDNPILTRTAQAIQEQSKSFQGKAEAVCGLNQYGEPILTEHTEEPGILDLLFGD